MQVFSLFRKFQYSVYSLSFVLKILWSIDSLLLDLVNSCKNQKSFIGLKFEYRKKRERGGERGRFKKCFDLLTVKVCVLISMMCLEKYSVDLKIIRIQYEQWHLFITGSVWIVSFRIEINKWIVIQFSFDIALNFNVTNETKQNKKT